MSDLKKALKELLPKLGARGVDKAGDVLDGLAKDTDEPWKRASLALLADAVDKYGMDGVKRAQDVLETLIQEEKPDIEWMDLGTASDVLAHLQNAEADRKSAAKDFLLRVGNDLGVFLSAVIKGLVASAL